MKTKILYVEDELALAQIVRDTLQMQGYDVRLVSDGAAVIKTAQEYQADICLLDIMLPHIDGYSLAKQLKQQLPHLPILFLTAKNQSADVVKGFRSGGADYMRKPFSMEELIVRIENLLKLHSIEGRKSKETIKIGDYIFSPQKLSLTIGQQERKLTYRESEIIQAFQNKQNQIIHKKQLLLDIWGDDTLSNTRSLDVYIAKLRDYFSDDPTISILTLRGVGYQFNVG